MNTTTEQTSTDLFLRLKPYNRSYKYVRLSEVINDMTYRINKILKIYEGLKDSTDVDSYILSLHRSMAFNNRITILMIASKALECKESGISFDPHLQIKDHAELYAEDLGFVKELDIYKKGKNLGEELFLFKIR